MSRPILIKRFAPCRKTTSRDAQSVRRSGLGAKLNIKYRSWLACRDLRIPKLKLRACLVAMTIFHYLLAHDTTISAHVLK